MKLSVSTYSYEQKMRRREIQQLDCIRLAKEMEFDAVEFSGLILPEGMQEQEYCEKIRKMTSAHEIPLSAYLIHLDFLSGDFDEMLTEGKHQIDNAVLMGAPMIRHDVAPGRWDMPFSKALPILSKACRALSEYAAEKGIRNVVENHGWFLQRSERIERLYEAVDHPNFGLLIDIGNFLCDDDVPYLAVSRLAPYALHVHAKDFYVKPASAPYPGPSYNLTSNSGRFLRPTIIGAGDVDVFHCLSALRKRVYNGYVTVEFEGMENCEDAVRMGRSTLLQYASTLNM